MHSLPRAVILSLLGSLLAAALPAAAQSANPHPSSHPNLLRTGEPPARVAAPTAAPAAAAPAAAVAPAGARPRSFFARGGGPGPFAFSRGSLLSPLPTFALELGVADYDRGIGNATYTGGHWGARVGLEFFPFFMVEARYFGAYHGTADYRVGDGVGVLTQGGSAVVRFTMPFSRIHPYVFGGVGAYRVEVLAPSGAQNNPLRSDTAITTPFGIGFHIPIDRHWSTDIEGGAHPLYGERFSTNSLYRNGELWTASAMLRYTL